MDRATEYNCLLRVLVVTDDLLEREALSGQLHREALQVYIAEGQGTALLQNARQQMQQHHCHVVIITPPAAASTNPSRFIRQLIGFFWPAGIVIHVTVPNDRLAFHTGHYRLEYVRASDPTAEILAAVIAQGRRRCQCTLSVKWPEPPEQFLSQARQALRLSEPLTLDNLYDLLGQAFRQASEVLLLPPPSQTIFDAPVRRAVVLRAQERRPQTNVHLIPKIIKIGARSQIEREFGNYHRYVDGRLMQNRHARLEKRTLIWHLGLIVYNFLGVSPAQSMMSFREFYLEKSPAEILATLQNLFLDVLRNWYHGERQEVRDFHLIELYSQRLQIDERLRRLDRQSPQLTFPDLPEPLPNPAYWLVEEGMETVFPKVTTCIVHGDLHGDNLLIEQHNPWLLDFEHTGPGHALHDFVELEADIKLRLTALRRGGLAGLVALDEALLAGHTLYSPLIPGRIVARDPALLKAFQVIAGLRHLACMATGSHNLVEYLHALLYETLFMATLSRLAKDVQERARLSAALIVRRLMRADLPPSLHIPNPDFASMPQSDSTSRLLLELKEHHHYLRTCRDSVKTQIMVYRGKSPRALVAGWETLDKEIKNMRGLIEAILSSQPVAAASAEGTDLPDLEQDDDSGIYPATLIYNELPFFQAEDDADDPYVPATSAPPD